MTETESYLPASSKKTLQSICKKGKRYLGQTKVAENFDTIHAGKVVDNSRIGVISHR